jgi:hypothetical protein
MGAYLVIDDMALPKKGTLSLGVARQYCGQLGKRANCQSLVLLTLAQDEVPVPVGLRLFLPDEWAGDAARCAQAGVPAVTWLRGAKARLPWPSWIAWLQQACGLAPCWPMRAMVRVLRFGMGWMSVGSNGRSSSRFRLRSRWNGCAGGWHSTQPEGL